MKNIIIINDIINNNNNNFHKLIINIIYETILRLFTNFFSNESVGSYLQIFFVDNRFVGKIHK